MIVSKTTLGNKLKEMYDNAPTGEQVLMVHLFGIKFADVIRDYRFSVKEIVEIAGINASYRTEVGKGMKMAQYVEVKKNMDKFDLE